ncbi:type II toxin-antitoxin system VapC family toxin [Brachybacterium squillarum]|uniref:type II toxin-antitoxin system VapC family toxin n=1 Tax=Brachybacterium squillarum TaxID=661979 RepID=UPI002223A9A0|nr:type II toxin-antitoxin system VapC family toxin [Brachybacterium squillarum]MCW1804669.1 type II toxin-antitoxin system VapC family toxin [Brachybacterium squillarum]
MTYLLDTNVLSDARSGRSPAVRTWLSRQEVEELHLSAVTIHELERGIRQKERADPAGALPLRRWLEEDVRPTFSGRIIPIDERAAIAAAALHLPDPMPQMDALIAATAAVHELTLVTRNIQDFHRAHIPLFDPWSA